MIDPALYVEVTKFRPLLPRRGGQELILPEIIGCFGTKPRRVWLPFYSSGTLANWLSRMGHEVLSAPPDRAPPEASSLYFGTPTIVNGRNLFPEEEEWTKEKERKLVREMVAQAEALNYTLIVSGLGSGDISVDERLVDMGGGRIVCYKDFGDFQDWILERRL